MVPNREILTLMIAAQIGTRYDTLLPGQKYQLDQMLTSEKIVKLFMWRHMVHN